MDKTEYFSMQGRVFIGIRNPDGSRMPARWVYDASVMETTQTKETEDKKESWSGERGLAATRATGRTMNLNITLGQLNTDNAALALEGARVEVTTGTVTGEIIGAVKAGDVWPLAYAAVSDLELEDSTSAALVLDTDYTVDEDLGLIFFLTTKAGVKGDYEYAAHSIVTAFNGPSKDYYVLFGGLNTVDGSSGRCRGEIYNVSLSPAETFGFIQDAFGELALTGKAKMDPFRRADPNWGPYGRLILIDAAA